MKRYLKKILISILIPVILVTVVVTGYVSYVSLQYYRIEDETNLSDDIISNQTQTLQTGRNYTLTTYNIGFGAYTQDFSFFMDSGTMKDGTKVNGTGSKAASKDTVITNTNGAIRIEKQSDADFMLFQEMDIQATRSHKVNQYEMMQNEFPDYGSVIARNFHSAFLFYPLSDPHGATESGIATFSRYQIKSAVRYQLPIDESFPNKFFDLDRCFMVTRIPVDDDKELVIINVHLSAYDEGGIIRAKQLETLSRILSAEKEKNNYVIVGGDFNHDIANTINKFPTEQEVPEWVYIFDSSKLPEGYSFAVSAAAPTCRSTDIPYQEGVNYTVVIDGFIVSDNVEKVSVVNVTSVDGEDVNFLYSDHNSVRLVFRLKP